MNITQKVGLFKIELNKDDFYKVGKLIEKSEYSLYEIVDLADSLFAYGSLYENSQAKDYACMIMTAVNKGNG